MARRRSFGAVRKLPSGRLQASYIGDDGNRHNAEHTFTTKTDADAWLSVQRAALVAGDWKAAPATTMTFDEWADHWHARLQLKERTLYTYRLTIDRDLSPTFGSKRLGGITENDVATWFDGLPVDRPAKRAQAYRVLKQILGAAVDARKIKESPCSLKRTTARSAPPHIEDAAPEDIDRLAALMPRELSLAVYLGAYCALRAGEVLGLRRRDIDLSTGLVHVRQSAGTSTPGGKRVGTPKTASSRRTVAAPGFVMELARQHLARMGDVSPDDYLFPTRHAHGGPITYQTLQSAFKRAAERAGHTGLTFHGLRHMGATLAAGQGATVRELMGRLGHTTADMAMRYQHASRERDRAIAARLDQYARPMGGQ